MCTGFPSFKLDLSKRRPGLLYTRHYLGPGFGCAADMRSYERCEGAGKNAVSLACHCVHWYSQSHGRVGELGSRLFRAAGNTETGLITTWQSFIRGCLSGLVGVPPLSVSPSECLFGRFQLFGEYRLKMLLRRRLLVEAQQTPPIWVLPSQVVVYISLGTSCNLKSFNSRSILYCLMRVPQCPPFHVV